MSQHKYEVGQSFMTTTGVYCQLSRPWNEVQGMAYVKVLRQVIERLIEVGKPPFGIETQSQILAVGGVTATELLILKGSLLEIR